MPLDPTISLNTFQPQQASNPLGMLGSVLDVQNKLNQQKLFNQTFMAKQKMGEMIATTPSKGDGTPDWDSIQQKFLSDPDVAPFAPQAMNEIRQLHLTNTQIAGEEQKQNMSGIGGLQKILAMGYNDPQQLKTAVSTWEASQPKDVRERLGPAASALVTGLTANLPKDPAAAQGVLQSRIIGNQVAQGVTPDVLSSLTGKNYSQDTGGGIQAGVERPAWQGGGRVPATMTPKTLAPQLADLPTVTGAQQKAIVGGMPQGGGLAGAAMPPAADAGLGLGPAAAPGAAALGIRPIAQGPDAAQSAYMGDRGKDMATYAKDLDQTVSEGGTLLKVIGEARQALQNFKPGGGGTMAANVAQNMQAINRVFPDTFSDATIGKIAGGTIQDAEEFRKLMGQAVLQVTRQNLPQGSRLAVQEFQSFEKNNPNLDTDPRAVDKVFSFWTKIYNQNHAEQQALAKDQSSGNPISTWPGRWQDMQQSKGFVSTDDKSYKNAHELRDDVAAGKITPEAATERAIAIWGPDRSKWPSR